MSFLDKETLKVVGTRPIRPDGVDKVTGRANFGADMKMPGMLWGKIKRSPHAHARIVSINTDKALALPGVKAVTTRADFPDIPPDKRTIGAMPHNLWDLSRNCMAKGKVLYEGHAVAAVAAVSPAIAEQALDLIEVEYEVLPHVMEVEAAMAEDAPVLHDDIFTAGLEPKPAKPSNVSKMVRFAKGDVEAGFAEADVVIERRYTTKPVHQAYIEPHACVVSVAADGQATIWSSSQGQFMVRAYTSRIAGAEDNASIRAIPAEIGGGFGGKTIIYLEPVAYMLSKKSGRPVKIVMSREEVFRATGPTSGAVVEGRTETFRPFDDLALMPMGVPARRLFGAAGAELDFYSPWLNLDVIPSARVEAVNDVVTGRDPLTTILATFGISLILQNYALWQFGPVARKIQEPFTGHFNLFYLEYPWYRLVIAALSAAISASTSGFLSPSAVAIKCFGIHGITARIKA